MTHAISYDAAKAISSMDLLLLAAGRGTRFGGGKLAAALWGKPLIHHAAEMFSALPFARKWVCAGPQTPGIGHLGFTSVPVSGESAMLGDSLRAGMSAAIERPPPAILIALADMPCITAAHISALAKAFDGQRIASSDGTSTMPPAIFGADWFAQLTALQGDQGARALLQGAPVLVADAGILVDVDTPHALQSLENASRMIYRSDK